MLSAARLFWLKWAAVVELLLSCNSRAAAAAALQKLSCCCAGKAALHLYGCNAPAVKAETAARAVIAIGIVCSWLGSLFAKALR